MIFRCCLGFWLVAAMTVSADSIYRSVDAEGRVTFSTLPPATGAQQVEELNVQAPTPTTTPDPTGQTVMSQLVDEADRLRAERLAREQARTARIDGAQHDLMQAYNQLDQAKVQQNYDWQGIAGGGRRLSEAYFSRIQTAENQVRAAQEALGLASR
ncbi:MAG: DUF4124 domain-containing protein [Pseudomonadota bacterium]